MKIALINENSQAAKNAMILDKINYTVARLDGDYAYLQKEDEPDMELKCVARALLPSEIVEGSRLVYEMMEYTMQNP